MSYHPIPRTVQAAFSILTVIFLIAQGQLQAATVEYDLTIARQKVSITGKPVWGMTINGGIPGPTLRFREGDLARIRVRNLMDVDTSIHWHGLLVPPDMDGVPYLSFPPIGPGATFTYEFLIRQSGTYWYHSHTSLQDQSGLYGALVIEPRQKAPAPARDHVILLSDWTDEDPHRVNRTLKRGSEWYALEKGSAQSILGAARLGMLGDYFTRELQRMPAMDIADVAYDRFLANGKPESTLPAAPHETVRLRIIDGSATTYFHLEFAGGPLTIVAADGQDVEPVEVDRLLIAVAETYDVLVTLPDTGAYELRATAHDGSAYASVWIGAGQRHPAPNVPRPNLYHAMGHIGLKQIFSLTPAGTMGMPDREVEAGTFDRPGMAGMGAPHSGAAHGTGSMDHGRDPATPATGGMDHRSDTGATHTGHAAQSHQPQPAAGADAGAGHGGHAPVMPAQAWQSGKKYGAAFGFLAADVAASGDLAMDGDQDRPWSPYAKLRATRSTALPSDRPVRQIRLTLDGDMERYVWFLNNKPLSESEAILVRKGEAVRLIMINRTMMHHPMHLHGHFFRVINGQEAFAPLKHTVDVAPMSTTVIEFDANEFGDWFFHCHLLYHMKAGMARVVHYEGYTPSPQLAALRPVLYRDPWYAWGRASLLSSMSEGSLKLANARHIFSADWEIGWQRAARTESEGTITYDRYLNPFLSVFAGVDLSAEGDTVHSTRGVLGFRYLLPFIIESRVWLDTDGGARIQLGKSFKLTPRLALFGEAQYDTRDRWEGKTGLSYLVYRDLSLVGQWHSAFGIGAGLQVRF